LDESLNLVSEAHDRDPLLQRRLRELVARLPPVPRGVMLLRYQEDLDPLEIARILDMSPNTVKSHLKRSLTILREQVTAFMGPDGALPEFGPSLIKRDQ
jgi:RNA polymerase sigma factor (sigma-70 family)